MRGMIMPILPRRVVLAVLIATALGCDSDASRALRIARYSESESRQALQSFLDAARRGDTTALRRLASDSVLKQVLRNQADGRFQRDYIAAAESSQINEAKAVLCGTDLKFTYQVEGDRRNGRASVRHQDGAWTVTAFSVLVEY